MGVEVVRDELDRREQDASRVKNLPEGMVGRWANKRKPERLERLQERGYVFVNATTAKGAKLEEDPRTGEVKVPDGSRHRGDLVLMMTSKENYDRRNRAKTDEAMRRANDELENYKEQARRSGLTIIDEPGDGRGYTKSFTEKDYEDSKRRR